MNASDMADDYGFEVGRHKIHFDVGHLRSMLYDMIPLFGPVGLAYGLSLSVSCDESIYGEHYLGRPEAKDAHVMCSSAALAHIVNSSWGRVGNLVAMHCLFILPESSSAYITKLFTKISVR